MKDAISKIMSKTMEATEGEKSTLAKAFLNITMPQMVPFNRPLGFKILKLDLYNSEVEIPFKRANKNHLGSIHAGALVTVGEYAAGLLLLKRMDYTKQRLVLKSLHAEYMKQARAASVACASWPQEVPQDVEEFRKLPDAIDVPMLTVIKSKDGTELAHIKTLWQIKPWAKVQGSKK